MIEVRRPEAHELDAYASCVETAFALRLAPEERELLVAGLNEHCLAGFEDGELVGTLGGYEAPLTLPGPVIAAALVLEDIAVLPTHRRRGVLSAMMLAALERARASGAHLVVLHAGDGALYGRYGFGPGCFAARYRVWRNAAALQPAPALSGHCGRVRLLSGSEALEAFPLVHEAVCAARPGEIPRRRESWPELLGLSDEARQASTRGLDERGAPASQRYLAAPPPYLAAPPPYLAAAPTPYLAAPPPRPYLAAPPRPYLAAAPTPARHLAKVAPPPQRYDGTAPEPLRYLAAYEEDGQLDGYAVYDLVHHPVSERGDGESDDPALTLRLVESCTTSVAAYHGLWSYLLGLDPAGEILTGQRPLDEPLRHLLADPRALRVASVADRTWLRLLEVAPALRARRYARPGSVALEVGDETCRWNEGRYELLVDPIGRAEVWGPLLRSEGSGEQVTLRLDAAALAAAYLGGTSFGELASAGRVIADRPESVVEADALFCFGPAPFCTAEL